jgi:hypothetical protein
MTVFWDVAPCSLVGTDRRFRAAYCFHLQADIALMMEAPDLLTTAQALAVGEWGALRGVGKFRTSITRNGSNLFSPRIFSQSR